MNKTKKNVMDVLKTVPVCLDWQRFDHKPTSEDAEKITARMEGWTDIEISKLAEILTLPHGRSFTPACCDGRRSVPNWRGQQLVVLDFDGVLSIEAVVERCKDFGVLGRR